jgi:hypothetical protein
MGFPPGNIEVRDRLENDLKDVTLRIPTRELEACKANAPAGWTAIHGCLPLLL